MTDLREKIVEAVEDDFYAIYRGDRSFDETADAIIALLRDSVKPLEWVETHGDYILAESACGSYGINVWRSQESGDVAYVELDGENYDSVDDAKAAAQAYYNRRILSTMGLDQC